MRRDRTDPKPLLHGWLALWLTILVVLAPLPLGGQIPVVWIAYTLLFGLTWLAYVATMWRATWPRPLIHDAPLIVLWGGVCAYAALQSANVPALAALVPFDSEAILSSNSLGLAPGMSLLVSLQWAGYGLLFLLVGQVGMRRRRAMTVLQTMYAAIVLHGIFALVQLSQWGDTILGSPKWAYLGSATGAFVNRNSFATYLSMGLVVGVSLLVHLSDDRSREARSWWSLGLVGSGLFGLIIALVATQSRMGLFAGLCGAVVTAVIGARAVSGQPRFVLPVLVGIVALGSALLLRGEGLLERIGTTDIDLDSRAAFYQQVVTMILSRPWLGYGAGAFELAFQSFHALPVSADAVWDKAHSTYLGLWTDLGVIVGSIPMLLVGWLGVRSFREAWRSGSKQTPSLAALGVVVVAAIHSVVDFSLEVQGVAVTFIAILALGTARSERSG